MGKRAQVKLLLLPNAIQREELIRAIAVQREAFNFAAELVHKHEARVCWRALRTAWLGWKKEIKESGGVQQWIVDAGFPLRVDTCGIRAFIRTRAAAEKRQKKLSKQKGLIRDPKRLVEETLMLEHAVDGKAEIRSFFPVPYIACSECALCLLRLADLPFRQYHHRVHADLQYFLFKAKAELVERLVCAGHVNYDVQIVWNKRKDTFHVLFALQSHISA
jgi:hypothetical protein